MLVCTQRSNMFTFLMDNKSLVQSISFVFSLYSLYVRAVTWPSMVYMMISNLLLFLLTNKTQ